MKVLVTGATGFIGKWVMKELNASEHTATAFIGDVRDKSTFTGQSAEVVIHLAALVTHRQQYAAEVLHEVNVRGVKNLLEAYPAAKIVYVSTVDILRGKLSEYAQTKLEAEKIVKERGNYVIIRLPSVFGPEQRQVKLIPLLFQKYCHDSECTIVNNNLNEYIYVEDVAKRLINIVDREDIWSNFLGYITFEGFKIKNFDLDIMIYTICAKKELPDLKPKERKFFSDLKQCLPTPVEFIK